MKRWGPARHLLIFLGIVCILANSSHTSVRVDPGEVLIVEMCGGGQRTIELNLPKTPPETTADHHCDACLSPVLLPRVGRVLSLITLAKPTRRLGFIVSVASPRTPLWPGAPPIGPPSPLTANA